jgi:endonuclease/exonuclease/phosphatase (EEP) superfamily protein YafD
MLAKSSLFPPYFLTIMDSSFSLNFLTLNVNGLVKADRRTVIFNSLLTLKHQDVIFLQETHLEAAEQIEAIQKQWDGVSLWHKGSYHSKGVGLLFAKKLQPTINKVYSDNEGRLMTVDCTFLDRNFTLINVYCPNHRAQRKVFLENLRTRVKQGITILSWEATLIVLKTQFWTKSLVETETEPPPDLFSSALHSR